MSEEQDTTALERFARDLHRIREDRDVSLSSIREATQVPESQLQAFEDRALSGQSRMNTVYLRAFVRAYAEALGLSPDPVVQYLDAALEGDYQNQLAVQFLDVPPSVVEEDQFSESEDVSGGEPEADSSPQNGSSDEDDVEGVPSTASTPSFGDSETDERAEETSVPEGSSSSGDLEQEAEKGEIDSPDRTASDHFAALRFSTELGNFWREHRNFVLLGGLFLFGIVLVGGLARTYLGGDDSSPPADVSSTASSQQRTDESSSSPDTTATERSEEPAPRTELTLGDTLHVTVVATGDVRELRVRQDDNLRRPYWIENGDAVVFPFTRRIMLQNQLDSLRLLFEQYPYRTSRTDSEGRIVITRDTAEQFADTLRASPVSVPSSPDTIWGGPPTSNTTPPSIRRFRRAMTERSR